MPSKNANFAAEAAALKQIADALNGMDDESACRVMSLACLQLGEYEHAEGFARMARLHRSAARRAAGVDDDQA